MMNEVCELCEVLIVSLDRVGLVVIKRDAIQKLEQL